MNRILYRLGDFGFSVDAATPRTLNRTNEYRWPSQDRIGREPALQFVGPGSDKIVIEGIQFTTWRGGLGQVDSMRSMAGKGKPLMFSDGRGTIFGKYCIARIEETIEDWIPGGGGAPRKQTWRLELAKYGEDA